MTKRFNYSGPFFANGLVWQTWPAIYSSAFVAAAWFTYGTKAYAGNERK